MSKKQRYTDDGILIEGKDWTPEDWRDLLAALAAVREKIAARHKTYDEAERLVDRILRRKRKPK